MAKLNRAHQRRIVDSCRTMTDLISDYFDARLSPSLKRAFEEHLKICPDCLSFLNTYRKTAELGAAVTVDEMPAAVRVTVLAFLRQKIHRIAVFVLSLISQAPS